MSDQPQPIYQVTTFTDMKRDILQFDVVGANPPKRIFRGSRQFQINPRTPPTLIVFDFDEKTVEECFKAYDLKWEKINAQLKMQAIAAGKDVGGIVPAKTLPPLPMGK